MKRVFITYNIDGEIMLITAVLSLVFNLILINILHQAPGHDHDHDHEGGSLEPVFEGGALSLCENGNDVYYHGGGHGHSHDKKGPAEKNGEHNDRKLGKQ